MKLIIAIIIGLAIGAGIVYWLLQQQINAQEKQVRKQEKELRNLEQSHESRLQDTIKDLQDNYQKQIQQTTQSLNQQWESRLQQVNQQHQQEIEQLSPVQSSSSVEEENATVSNPSLSEEEIPTVIEDIPPAQEENSTVLNMPLSQEEIPTVIENVPPAQEENSTVLNMPLSQEEIPTVIEDIPPFEEEDVTILDAPLSQKVAPTEVETVSPEKEDSTDSEPLGITQSLEVASEVLSSPSFSQLGKQIYAPDPQTRTAIAASLEKLARSGSLNTNFSQAIILLGKLSHDLDPTVRQSAIKALGQIKSAEVIPVLQQSLKDANSKVVKAASDALNNYKSYPTSHQTHSVNLPGNSAKKENKD